jgi:hypothetical protein
VSIWLTPLLPLLISRLLLRLSLSSPLLLLLPTLPDVPETCAIASPTKDVPQTDHVGGCGVAGTGVLDARRPNGAVCSDPSMLVTDRSRHWLRGLQSPSSHVPPWLRSCPL